LETSLGEACRNIAAMETPPDWMSVTHADPERRVVVGAAAGGGAVHPDRGLNRTGALPRWLAFLKMPQPLRHLSHPGSAGSPPAASNLINNLRMGLTAATTSQTAQVPVHVMGTILIGVDLGPNLSVTGRHHPVADCACREGE
jgi:hypothetical protein